MNRLHSRNIALGLLASLCAAGALAGLTDAKASPAADGTTLMQVETLNDHDRWQGRHHYLYDDEDRPGIETTGSAAPANARACSNEPVRLRRSDGSTVVRRLRRCD